MSNLLQEKVIVIENSTGTALATWLATKVDDLGALIVMLPNFQPPNKAAGLLLFPREFIIVRIIEGKYHEFEPKNPDHVKYWAPKSDSSFLLSKESHLLWRWSMSIYII